jgi:hypothetical protein
MGKLGHVVRQLREQINEMGEMPPEAKAREIGDELGIDWDKIPISEFRMGLAVELEHGNVDPQTNVSDDDWLITGKIALAHLKEFPDYYTKLQKVEPDIAKLRSQLSWVQR